MKVIFPRIETLHFHGAFDGGSKFIQCLAEELVKLGIEVEIVTTRLKNNPLRKTKYNGVTYTFLPPIYSGKKRFLNLPYKYIFSNYLKKYLEKTDFDILHSTEMFSYSYLHQKRRKPVIFQCWALEAWPLEKLKPKGMKNIYNRLILRPPWQYCIEHSNSVAADGKFQLPRLKKIGVPREKIWFIPNGVEFRKIDQLRKRYKDRRKDLGIKKEDPLVLSICQIAPDKGIDDIIRGFALIKEEIKNARLLLVGKGKLEPMMHELFKKNNLVEEKDVFHRKNVPEGVLHDYLFNSDIFVSAVISEDFMISIQEGMAAGLPIVSSAQPFLVKDGVNGYVVGFNNPKGIAEGILRIWKKGRKNMKKMGLISKKMARQYDYDILAEMAIKEYKKLIPKN